MHALYRACIFQICLVLKEYGECSCKERRGSLHVVSSLSFFSSLKRQKDLFWAAVSVWWFLVDYISDLWSRRGGWNRPCWLINMGTKMKGIYKAGFKYISNIFVVKERELEIGYPTDVKHVAHIGWEGSSGTAPTWMSEFRKGPEFAATTIGNNGSSLSPWSSRDFGESKGNQKSADLCKKDTTSPEVPNMPKPKQKRKKSRSTSSPKLSGSTSSSSRSLRAAKSKTKFAQGSTKPINIEPKSINIEVA